MARRRPRSRAIRSRRRRGSRPRNRSSTSTSRPSAVRNWRTGFGTEINDRRVNVVQGNLGTGGIATLAFDAETGLLVRMLRYGPSPDGRIVTRVDYTDYREVGNTGVKMPFKWTMSWLDGRNVYALANVQPNARIDPAKFAKPVPAK